MSSHVESQVAQIPETDRSNSSEFNFLPPPKSMADEEAQQKTEKLLDKYIESLKNMHEQADIQSKYLGVEQKLKDNMKKYQPPSR